ncbi:hypothetical protein [Bradyrhizobium sp. S69]|uniref:hypothetical protein n=1 Tax=Bradyrhizobium sp. S69 TaxID=1641856 RepID=UPI00131D6EF8|nr:hypothetical protein [Bradyrhizobium sp. S69]
MKHEHSSSAPVDRTSLPRALVAAGALLLATVCAASAATQGLGPNERGSAPALASNASARETLKGVVASTNEQNDTLTIQLASTGISGDFKVLDGLIFNSVRYGDLVEITVEMIGGMKTIVALTRE